jgi:hypothetical protein
MLVSHHLAGNDAYKHLRVHPFDLDRVKSSVSHPLNWFGPVRMFYKTAIPAKNIIAELNTVLFFFNDLKIMVDA